MAALAELPAMTAVLILAMALAVAGGGVECGSEAVRSLRRTPSTATAIAAVVCRAASVARGGGGEVVAVSAVDRGASATTDRHDRVTAWPCRPRARQRRWRRWRGPAVQPLGTLASTRAGTPSAVLRTVAVVASAGAVAAAGGVRSGFRGERPSFFMGSHRPPPTAVVATDTIACASLGVGVVRAAACVGAGAAVAADDGGGGPVMSDLARCGQRRRRRRGTDGRSTAMATCAGGGGTLTAARAGDGAAGCGANGSILAAADGAHTPPPPCYSPHGPALDISTRTVPGSSPLC